MSVHLYSTSSDLKKLAEVHLLHGGINIGGMHEKIHGLVCGLSDDKDGFGIVIIPAYDSGLPPLDIIAGVRDRMVILMDKPPTGTDLDGFTVVPYGTNLVSAIKKLQIPQSLS